METNLLSSSFNNWVLLRYMAHIAIDILNEVRAFSCSIEPVCVYLKSMKILSAIFCWHLHCFSIVITETPSVDIVLRNKI